MKIRPPPLTPDPSSVQSSKDSNSSDTQTMIDALILDILHGDKPRNVQDAKKLYDVVSKLLACWMVTDLPEKDRAGVEVALYTNKEAVKCWSWCCPEKK